MTIGIGGTLGKNWNQTLFEEAGKGNIQEMVKAIYQNSLTPFPLL